MSVCVICRRPQQVERLACVHCQQRMDGQLVDVLEFYALAESELLPGSGSGCRGSEQSIGVRISALDYLAGYDAVNVLVSWESDWRETYGLSVQPMISRPGPLLARTVAFLRSWLPRACDDFAAIDDFAHELADAWSEGRTAARMTPASNTTITCPADDERHADGLCGKRIAIDADSRQVQCLRCGTTWDVLHLIHVAIATPGADIWADPEATAGYFRMNTTDLQRLARVGQVRISHGRYELHDVHAAIQSSSYTRLARVIGAGA